MGSRESLRLPNSSLIHWAGLQLGMTRFRARQSKPSGRGAVKKLVTTILLLAGVAAPAGAQMPGSDQSKPSINMFGDGFHLKTDVEVKQEQDRERAYKSGISNIPDQKAKNDPWGAVRETPPTASNQRPTAK
jgi:hypothetical protein